ncbi:hypothetical protein [Variovorax jilinensis]|uniref:hypothetical protein n=1 Tax=Variovorax jilinensis TaxID=3053513 RepID=UPI0025774D1A|nr:hypothetical protein [Variovorax sp. J22P168]
MTAHHSPSFALRPQRDGVRQKQLSLSRPRAAGSLLASQAGAGTFASDSVFKRFPAIGDTPSFDRQRG